MTAGKTVRFLGAALALVLAGCVGGDQTGISWNPPGGWEESGTGVVDAFRMGRYEESLAKAQGFSEQGERVDRLRWQMEMISNLLLGCDAERAHRLMMSTREDIELLFDPDSERKAVSLWHGEQAKAFKGDGWERATLYALLALSCLDRGDWENAMRCAKNGLLSDSDSLTDAANADYALLPYLGYLAAQRAGADAEAKEFAAQYRNIIGEGIPQAAQAPDSLLLVWVGEGVTYKADGDYAQRRKVVEGAIEGRLESVGVTAGDGRTWYSLPAGIADLNAQARGRGPRQMDQVLQDKATTKAVLTNSGKGLLAVSAAMMVVGTSDLRLAVVLYPTAAATALLGGGVLLSGEAVVADADTRVWACLPGRLLVVPLRGAEGTVRVSGYMGWDEIYAEKLSLAAPRQNAIRVLHRSLLPERLAVHANWKRQVLDSVDELINAQKLPENENRMEIR
ncbi:MAG: hypothetical protein Q4G65_13250 [bacterium]|nr:hypothetical protein [bacterium]